MIEMSVEVVASARVSLMINDLSGEKYFISITKEQYDMLQWLSSKDMIYYEVDWENLSEIELERI